VEVLIVVTPAEFYDALAFEYHLLFGDWWSAAQWHGEVIADVLATRGITDGRLLDCTCGIGTQALPLAGLGFRVTGTDVSREAIARARAEATTRGLDADFEVGDVRDARRHVAGSFDVVISCDNALPHLLTHEDLERALRSVRSCLRPGGLLLASLRDYDSLRITRPDGLPITVHGEVGSRHGSGQIWQWSAGADFVDIELFTLTETDAESWQARSRTTRYRALQRATLDSMMMSVGFHHTEWLMPDDSGYYQPIVLATA
jgi:SAM-dependent methyltransferase